jgi:hypothetical protein
MVVHNVIKSISQHNMLSYYRDSVFDFVKYKCCTVEFC